MLAVISLERLYYYYRLQKMRVLISIIFEVASAFGTCGASMGITPRLDLYLENRLLILLMFIGRIGILSFLFTMSSNEKAP